MKDPRTLRPFHHMPDPQHFEDLDRLGEDISELAAHITAATFQLLELIGIFDEQEGWARHGARSCAHWLQWKCGTNLGAAREKVRVARALPELPQITKAFREGRISYSKVRAMTRVATWKNEDSLPNTADGRFSRNAVYIKVRNRDSGLDITARTLPPRWYGEKMDRGMVIEALYRRE